MSLTGSLRDKRLSPVVFSKLSFQSLRVNRWFMKAVTKILKMLIICLFQWFTREEDTILNEHLLRISMFNDIYTVL